MSTPPETDFDPILLDYHLGQLSEDERCGLRSRMESEPQLSAQSEVLGVAIAALGSTPAPKAPEALASRICSRVRGMSSAQRPTLALSEELERNSRRNQLYSFRDILAVAAMVVFAVGLGVPSLLLMRQRSQITNCTANLAQVGRGLQAYAATFAGNLPFVGWDDKCSWRPTDEVGVRVVPNRRHLYPLLVSRNVTTSSFVCPSTKDVAMPSQQITSHSDFLESRNISYANQNMAGMRPTLSADPAMPILGDDNPIFDNGQPLIDFAADRLGLTDPARSNSLAHGGRGQNILTIGGSVRWTRTPNAGIAGDNIWTLDRVKEYTGREGPQRMTDSHLIK